MLINLFELLGVEKPSYLDIGAHHPSDISNTRLLYERGSRGVNVEANPELIEAFRRERPEDKNICVGIGPVPGILPFYIYSEKSGLNTFCPKEVEKLKPSLEPRSVKKLPLVTLDHTVKEFCSGLYPHMLLVDIEGLDYDVLKGADFHGVAHPIRSPYVICVETRPHDTGRMENMLDDKGYALHCRMGENLFFVQLPLFSKVY